MCFPTRSLLEKSRMCAHNCRQIFKRFSKRESKGSYGHEIRGGRISNERIIVDPFYDRAEAGQQLAEELRDYANQPDVAVLGLPRGGVAVAAEVARALHVPLDVFVVRKLGLPGHEELAMGAIASGGVRVLNHDVIRALDIPEDVIEEVAAREQQELERRERLYRGDRPPPDVRGRTVILIDDGLATGSSMRAAVAALKHMKPRRIVVAVPVASRETCEEFGELVDDVVCVERPEPFMAVGRWYEDFSQTTDEEVHGLLEKAGTQQVPA